MTFSETTTRHKSKFDSGHLSGIKGHKPPGIRDFEIIKPISRGAFGQVYLAKKNGGKQFYAVKSMKKCDVLNKNMMEQVVAERDALAISSKSPYVVQLFYSFHSNERIFLVMEYMIGGDLKSLLHNLGYFEVKMAKIYIAEVTLALEYLHRHSIYHRDIKPDNMLLSDQGHIKLTDFGLSCISSERKPNIIDLMNTPGIMNKKFKNDRKIFWRTPGQLQSLTSNFSFSIPRLKEEDPHNVRRVRLNTLKSISLLKDSSSFKFSPPQAIVDNNALGSVSILSTPKGCRKSSTPNGCPITMDTDNKSGLTLEITSLNLAPIQQKRNYADLGSPTHFEKENENPHKRQRVMSHSMPYELEISSSFIHDGNQRVRFDESVKNCGCYSQSELDCLFPPSKNCSSGSCSPEHRHTSGAENISGVTALTENSHMSLSYVLDMDRISPECSNLCKTYSNNKFTPSPCQNDVDCKINSSLTPNNIFTRARPNSADIVTPVQNLCFNHERCLEYSPAQARSTCLESPISCSRNTSKLESTSNIVKVTPKKTPSRTPKNCVRGVATPLEKKRILGTPDYLAPEILLGLPHGAPVDYWALGVCFYEFLTGIPPFNDDTPELVFHHILEHDMIWPEGEEELPKDCVDAINLLLTEDPFKRPNAEGIKAIPCFADISWNDLDTQEAPFIPEPDDEYDTTYFTARNLANHLQMSNFKS